MVSSDGKSRWSTLAAIAAVIVGGRFLSRPLFGYIAAAKLREIFTAAALLLVIGIALLMTLVGLSPAWVHSWRAWCWPAASFGTSWKAISTLSKACCWACSSSPLAQGIDFSLLHEQFALIMRTDDWLDGAQGTGAVCLVAGLQRPRWRCLAVRHGAGPGRRVRLCAAWRSRSKTPPSAVNWPPSCCWWWHCRCCSPPVLFILLDKMILPRHERRQDTRCGHHRRRQAP